jgi:hypothetical protein
MSPPTEQNANQFPRRYQRENLSLGWLDIRVTASVTELATIDGI